MDGGGRLLRSLIGAAAGLLIQTQPRFAGLPADFEDRTVHLRTTRRGAKTRSRARLLVPRTTRGGRGLVLVVALFAATGVYGSVRGGQYAEFVKANGSPFDLVAKAAGFPIDAITISGIKQLDQTEILSAAAIDPSHSLLFLNAADVRDRLKAMPLVRDAVVTKLFPNRLTIAVDERDPVALWQLNGQLSIVSGDGVVIDTVRDDRFSGLPFVVGEGANNKVGDFLALLDAAGDLRSRVVAGILVADRRWTLKMDSGVEVKLPETDAKAAVARLVALDQQAKLLDKDLVSIDLRRASRISVRLSDDAAAARAEMLAKKPKSKGPAT
jgi:cell division protein FtsQ